MQKAQREYSIQRAKRIINKAVPSLEIPTLENNEMLSIIGIEEYKGGFTYWEVVRQAIEKHHPSLITLRKEISNAKKENIRRNKIRDNKKEEITDFIMLGNNKEIIEMLRNLSDWMPELNA